MPTSVSSTSNYVGRDAGLGVIGKAFKEADTINKGLITFAQNVNSKVYIRKIQYTNGKTAYSCGFDPAGGITLSERILEPVKVKNDLQICKETFRNQWSQDLMGSSAYNLDIPSDIKAAMTEEILKDTAEDTDYVIWNGDNSSNPEEWDGFITLFSSDSNVIKAGNGITSSSAAVTKSNVLTEFDKATAAIPSQLRKKPLQMIVSSNVADAYYKKLIESGVANGLGGDANTLPKYGRYMPVEVQGLPDNTIVIYEKGNLVFGTGLLGDHNTFSLVDEDEIGLLTGQMRGKMVYNGGVQYANSEDIVWYLTTT